MSDVAFWPRRDVAESAPRAGYRGTEMARTAATITMSMGEVDRVSWLLESRSARSRVIQDRYADFGPTFACKKLRGVLTHGFTKALRVTKRRPAAFEGKPRWRRGPLRGCQHKTQRP